MKDGWINSDLFCTCCGQLVTKRRWDSGFMVMRCQCIRKAGHSEVMLSEWWIDKRCQGDEQATRLEMMQASSSDCFD